MRVSCALSLFLVLAAAAPAAAQEKPDFTGTWVLASPNGAAANVPPTVVVTESFRRESVSGVLLPSPIILMQVERRAANGEVTSDNFTVGTIGGVVGGRSADAVPVRRNFAA